MWSVRFYRRQSPEVGGKVLDKLEVVPAPSRYAAAQYIRTKYPGANVYLVTRAGQRHPSGTLTLTDDQVESLYNIAVKAFRAAGSGGPILLGTIANVIFQVLGSEERYTPEAN